jgi:hypothetical protein
MKACVKRGGQLTAALLVSTILAACGGDSNGDGNVAAAPAPSGVAPPAAANSVPAGAAGSVAAYLAYLRGLKTDETSTPVSVGSFVAPVDDTAAATPLGS